jgi:hypothetical protein
VLPLLAVSVIKTVQLIKGLSKVIVMAPKKISSSSAPGVIRTVICRRDRYSPIVVRRQSVLSAIDAHGSPGWAVASSASSSGHGSPGWIGTSSGSPLSSPPGSSSGTPDLSAAGSPPRTDEDVLAILMSIRADLKAEPMSSEEDSDSEEDEDQGAAVVAAPALARRPPGKCCELNEGLCVIVFFLF